jgi:hypothetical protein
MQLGRDRIQRGLIEPTQVGAPGEVLAEQPVGVLVAAALPGLRGSQKETWTPESTVNWVCSASSLPWSQVRERRSCSGSRRIAVVNAGRTCWAVTPSGSGTNTT